VIRPGPSGRGCGKQCCLSGPSIQACPTAVVGGCNAVTQRRRHSSICEACNWAKLVRDMGTRHPASITVQHPSCTQPLKSAIRYGRERMTRSTCRINVQYRNVGRPYDEQQHEDTEKTRYSFRPQSMGRSSQHSREDCGGLTRSKESLYRDHSKTCAKPRL